LTALTGAAAIATPLENARQTTMILASMLSLHCACVANKTGRRRKDSRRATPLILWRGLRFANCGAGKRTYNRDPLKTTLEAAMKRFALTVCLLSAAAVTTQAFSAAAPAAYPNRVIRLITPYAPGGGTDIMARTISQKLTEAFGQSVIVDNRAGAGGVVGTEIAAKSPPDGYTILLGSPSPLTVAPHLYKKLPYDPLKDLAPVCLVAVVPNILAVHPSLPVRSVKDLIALAKARPGQLTFSSSGNGGSGHLAGEMFKSMAGVDLVHVPYRGTAPAATALLSGEVSMSFGNVVAFMPQVKAGRLHAIALTSLKRAPALPDIPTVAETIPGYTSGTWSGILAPAGTPQEIIARLNAEIAKIPQVPVIRDQINSEGGTPVGSTAEEFGTFMKQETARLEKVIKGAKIRVE
jgi:tripartite-type tricarboxylate transporter receptor subunit TctC